MTSTNGDQNVLKLDERGRVRMSRERREAVLAEFDRSGLSGAKFARLAGIKYPTFMYWLKQRRDEHGDGGESGGVGFVEALIEGASQRAAGEGLLIELAGAARVRVESPLQLQLAAELIRLLMGGR
jgi:transposase-like protein